MYTIELRVRALLRQGVVEFVKLAEWPFAPSVGIALHVGPDPDVGEPRALTDVIWVPADELGQGHFLVQIEDDVEAAATYADDYESLLDSYTSRGWQEFRSTSLRVVGWPNPAPATA
jgi:hypothetical protein